MADPKSQRGGKRHVERGTSALARPYFQYTGTRDAWVILAISDNHPGPKAARGARLPRLVWQRRQFHLHQNTGHYIPRLEMRPRAASGLRAILNAPNRVAGDRLLQLTVGKYEKTAPKLSASLTENAPEGSTIFAFTEHTAGACKSVSAV